MDYKMKKKVGCENQTWWGSFVFGLVKRNMASTQTKIDILFFLLSWQCFGADQISFVQVN